jgi:glucosyl-3-phosphoglycerate synthase
MDFDQGCITTIHDFGFDRSRTLSLLEEFKEERPINLVLPVAFEELSFDALPGMLPELNRATFLNEVVIALYATSREDFHKTIRFFKQLELPHRVMWCNSPGINRILEELQSEGIDITTQGKGRDSWLAMGAASLNSYGIIMHDADIVNYSYEIPMKLAYPMADPDLDYFFNKGYYARLGEDQTSFFGRVARLFVHPIIESLLLKTKYQSDFLRYLRSFKYPLSGEIALTSDLALNIRIPMDWGLEIGTLYEVYRSAAKKRICQTDLGFFDHKHKHVGEEQSEGLLKMSGDILITILRVMTEIEGTEISPAFLHSLRVMYRRKAQDIISQFYADAVCNQIQYNRHEEKNIVESFETVIMNAGTEYLNAPSESEIPTWLRATSALPKLRKRLLQTIIEDEKSIQ